MIFTWIIIVLLYGFQALFRQSTDILQDYICNDHHIHYAQYFSYYVSSYTLGYAAVQIPFGILFDRINHITLMKYILYSFILGLFLYIFHLHYFNINIGMFSRFITGIAAGSIYNAGVKVANIYFGHSDSILTKKISQLIFYGIVSVMIGEKILNILMQYTGPKISMTIFCFIGILFSIIFCLYTDGSKYNEIEKTRSHPMHDLMILLKDYKFIALVLLSGILYASLLFSSAFAIILIQKVYCIESYEILYMYKISTLAGILCGLQFWIKLKQRMTFILCPLLNVICILLLVSHIIYNQYILILLFFMIGSGMGISPSIAPIYIKKFHKMKSLAVSVSNMFAWLIMSFLVFIVSYLSEHFTQGYIIFSPMIILSIFATLFSILYLPYKKW